MQGINISPNLMRVLVSTAPDLLAELFVAGKVLDAEVLSTFQDRAMLAFGRGIRLEVALQAALQAGQKVKLQVQQGEPGGPLVLKLVQTDTAKPERAPTGGSADLRQPSLPSPPGPGVVPPSSTGYAAASRPLSAGGQGGVAVQASPQGQPSRQGQPPSPAEAAAAQGEASAAAPAAPAAPEGQRVRPQSQASTATSSGAPSQAGDAVPRGQQGQVGVAHTPLAQGRAAAAVPAEAQGDPAAPFAPAPQHQAGAAAAPRMQGQAGVAVPTTAEGQAGAAATSGAPAPSGAPGEHLPQVDGSQGAPAGSLPDGAPAPGPQPESRAPERTQANGQAELTRNQPDQPPVRPDGAASSAPALPESSRSQQAPTAASAQAPLAQARTEPGAPPLFWLPIPLPDGKQGWAQVQIDPEEGKRRSNGGVSHQIRLWWDTPALGRVEVTLDAAQQNLTTLFTVLSGAVRQGVELSLAGLQQRLGALGFQEVRVGCRQAMPGEAIAPVAADGGPRLNRRL